MAYDDSNIFAKILRGEIPCNKVYEDDHTLAFHDVNPQAPVHVLVIPKGQYTDFSDFASRASDAEMAAITRAIREVARLMDVESSGYRVLSNCGSHAGQEVHHLHFHVFAGRPLGPMLARAG